MFLSKNCLNFRANQTAANRTLFLLECAAWHAIDDITGAPDRHSHAIILMGQGALLPVDIYDHMSL